MRKFRICQLPDRLGVSIFIYEWTPDNKVRVHVYDKPKLVEVEEHEHMPESFSMSQMQAEQDLPALADAIVEAGYKTTQRKAEEEIAKTNAELLASAKEVTKSFADDKKELFSIINTLIKKE